MRRLFSTFAHGWPGVGLLLLRLAAGIALIAEAITRLRTGPPLEVVIRAVLAMGGGSLLFVGLWTPISGWLVAVLALWNTVSQAGDRLANILLATLGAALALVGPGAWSIDAWLYGWKRIDVRERMKGCALENDMTTSDRIGVLAVDDHAVFRQGIAAVIRY